MLNEEEENRLASCIAILKEERDAFDVLTQEAQLWLATKLRETNDELAKVHLELQKTNEELARVWEVYGP